MKWKTKRRMKIRLNKYISDSGVSSRRKAEEFIVQGRVTVNNKTIKELSFKVDENDEVSVDGERIIPRKHVYLLMNKPRGVVTTTSDDKSRRTVIDLINTREKIYPVGRLDYNTTGVLLLTNDGDFSFLLTHPKNRVPREYEVKLDKALSETDEKQMLKGVYMKGQKGVFKKISFPNKRVRETVLVNCIEGRNHFVKNMFGALGYRVESLNRQSFAGIIVDIPQGAFRHLSKNEVSGVMKNYAR